MCEGSGSVVFVSALDKGLGPLGVIISLSNLCISLLDVNIYVERLVIWSNL